MKTSKHRKLLSLAVLLIPVASCVQQPAPQTMGMAGKADCAMMKDMDHSKMDMHDPKMKAMMEQCMGGHPPDSKAPAGGPASHTDPGQAQEDEHNH
jgi:hypothetical protein